MHSLNCSTLTSTVLYHGIVCISIMVQLVVTISFDRINTIWTNWVELLLKRLMNSALNISYDNLWLIIQELKFWLDPEMVRSESFQHISFTDGSKYEDMAKVSSQYQSFNCKVIHWSFEILLGSFYCLLLILCFLSQKFNLATCFYGAFADIWLLICILV